MARKEKHTIDEVLRTLNRKNDVRVDPNLKFVFVLHNESAKKANDLGNGSWGKIDFLTNHNGFRLVFVDKF